MTRIVTTHYHYKRPPRKRKPVAIEGPTVVKAADPAKVRKRATGEPVQVSMPIDTSDTAKPAKVLGRHNTLADAPPANDERMPALVRARVLRRLNTSAPVKAVSANDDGKPAIVTAKPKRRPPDGPPLPMELPLSRKPAADAGDDYKRLKAAMARRLRGE